MPVLPDPNQLTRATPSAQTGVVRVDTSIGADALVQTGQALGQTARRAFVFAEQTADLHAQDALVELKRRQNQMTVGDDGYARLRNGAATEPGVVQRYQEQHKQQVDDISINLSPMARSKFEQRAREMGNQFQAGLLTHIMREDLNHRGEVYKASIAVSAETMGLNYNNPDALSRERAAIDSTVAKYVADNGIRDDALIERMLQESRGLGHKAVIEAYVDNGQAGAAEEYFNSVKQEILPEMAKSITNALKPEIANQMGRDVSDKLFQMHLEGQPESIIFEEKLKLTQGRGVDVLRATDALYEDRIRALKLDRARLSGDILVDAWEGRAGMNDPRLRRIDAFDPVLGAQLRGQMFSIQKRNAAASSAGGAVATQNGMAAYASISAAIREGNTEPELITDAIVNNPHLGKAEVKELLRMRDSATTAAGKAKLSTNLINAGMPKSASSTEKKNAYKGFVERKLFEWKEANPGKIPTFADQQAIIASASEEHVRVNKFWFNQTVEAYRLEEGERSFPQSFAQQMQGRDVDDILAAYNFVQNFKARLPRGVPVPTDAELIVRWERSQQK